MAHSEFVGVDWCPSGWLSVGFMGSDEYELKTFPKFGELLACYETAKLILLDIPIGLPTESAERLCDKEAKDLLKGFRDWSVFPVPARKTLEHIRRNPRDMNGASKIQMDTTGESLTDETRRIIRRIDEVDNVLATRVSKECPQVREVHPEILFWAMNPDEKPMDSKHKRRGIEERIDALSAVEPRTKQVIQASYCRVFIKHFNSADVLDALAAAVTAYRGWPDDLRKLPIGTEEKDEMGLPMEMVFWKPPKRTGT